MRTIIVFLVLIAAGCSTSRKLTSSAKETRADRTAADVIETSAGHSLRIGGSVDEQMADWWSRRVVSGIMYDTSKPADPSTGKPPVLAEFRIEDTTSGKRVSVKRDSSAEIACDTIARVNRSKYDIQEEREVSVAEKTSRRVPWWVIPLLMAAAALLGYAVRRR